MISEKNKNRLKELLRIPSVQSAPEEGKPFGGAVYACLCGALQMMKESNFSVKNIDGYCGYGEIGEGELFGILCHLDVVPAGDGWHYPPFGAVEENNRIYARGALDDKSPFLSVLAATERLLAEGYRPTKRIRVILGCNEESGWACMDRYCQTEEMPVLGFSPDGDFPVINCEKGIVYHELRYPKPASVRCLEAGERANMVPDKASFVAADGLRTEVVGVSAHGSQPEKGDNALIKLLSRIKEPFAEELVRAFSATDGSGIGLRLSDKVSGNLSLNLGTARTVGEELVFELDIRHPISYSKDDVTKILSARLSCTVTQKFFHLPLYVAPDHPLVEGLLSSYNEVMHTNAAPVSIGGGTYARILPCGVAFGPCFPDSSASIHCADEYIDLDEWEKATEIYYRALKKLCFCKETV